MTCLRAGCACEHTKCNDGDFFARLIGKKSDCSPLLSHLRKICFWQQQDTLNQKVPQPHSSWRWFGSTRLQTQEKKRLTMSSKHRLTRSFRTLSALLYIVSCYYCFWFIWYRAIVVCCFLFLDGRFSFIPFLWHGQPACALDRWWYALYTRL